MSSLDGVFKLSDFQFANGNTNPYNMSYGFGSPMSDFSWSRFYSAPSVAASYTPASSTPSISTEKLAQQDKIVRGIQERTLQTEEEKHESVAQSAVNQLKAIDKDAHEKITQKVGFGEYVGAVGKGILKLVKNTFCEVDNKGDIKGINWKNLGTMAVLGTIGLLCPGVGTVMAIGFGAMAANGIAKSIGTMFSDTTTKEQRLNAAGDFGAHAVELLICGFGVRSGIRLSERIGALKEARFADSAADANTGGLRVAVKKAAGDIKEAVKGNHEDYVAQRQTFKAVSDRAAKARGDAGTAGSSGINKAAANDLSTTLKDLLDGNDNGIVADSALKTKIQNIYNKLTSQEASEQYNRADLEKTIGELIEQLPENNAATVTKLSSALDLLAGNAPKTGRYARFIDRSGKSVPKEAKVGVWGKLREMGSVYAKNPTKAFTLGVMVPVASGQAGPGFIDSVVNYSENDIKAQRDAEKQKVLDKTVEVAKALKLPDDKIAIKDNESLSIDQRVEKLTKAIETVHEPFDKVYKYLFGVDKIGDLSGKSPEEIRQAILASLNDDIQYLGQRGLFTEDKQRDLATDENLARWVKDTAAKLRKEADDKAQAEAKKQQDAMNQRMAQLQTGFTNNPFATMPPIYS